MEQFIFHNPTKLIFGRGQIEQLKKELAPYERILMVYGGGSIKKNGVYDDVVSVFRSLNKWWTELAGVEPNPRLSTVQKGIDICRAEKVDFILAVGGGSVIDCAKAIAAGVLYDGDAWDFISRKTTVQHALPLGTVLTLAATGSEMNSNSVITNWETKEKYGWSSPAVFPKFSILDPVYTTTVPKDHTVYGIVDIMSHVLEQYFHHAPNTPLQDRMCEAILRTVIETAPKLIEDLENVDHRETILYCGTMALNGILRMGLRGDWATHNIEHAVSAVHDIPHAGGLAILFPNWMKHVLDEHVERFKQLAVRVFHVYPEGKGDREIALEGIEKLRAFWNSLGAPNRLADYHIGKESLPIIVEKAMAFGPFGNFKKLQHDDVMAILKASL
ncbi:hypothetical protein SAMN05216169_100710 [Anoxybacillus pushchinoensis]|uniref:long-chain-alcohol dehydrogenase n=1 Tax=Anoxybacillus pushchinoensis TaxID=150248 RepID=A0A1I0SU64_9BACL|nr:iron-containing alcohol dehydrogenase [Anoxybacillus pushchinoensis]SFA43065.1 hypothetical protein SAMN05216169_100710 [Anoxybacillus pushchinoensis]